MYLKKIMFYLLCVMMLCIFCEFIAVAYSFSRMIIFLCNIGVVAVGIVMVVMAMYISFEGIWKK
jgi:hypothetical protein